MKHSVLIVAIFILWNSSLEAQVVHENLESAGIYKTRVTNHLEAYPTKSFGDLKFELHKDFTFRITISPQPFSLWTFHTISEGTWYLDETSKRLILNSTINACCRFHNTNKTFEFAQDSMFDDLEPSDFGGNESEYVLITINNEIENDFNKSVFQDNEYKKSNDDILQELRQGDTDVYSNFDFSCDFKMLCYNIKLYSKNDSNRFSFRGNQIALKKDVINLEGLNDIVLQYTVFPNPESFHGFSQVRTLLFSVRLPINQDKEADTPIYDYYVIDVKELTYPRVTQFRMKDEIVIPTTDGLIWRGMEFVKVEE